MSKQDYVGSAIGGAVAAETLLYTGSPLNATTQELRLLSGKQVCFNGAAVLGHLLEDAAFGKLVPELKVRGLNNYIENGTKKVFNNTRVQAQVIGSVRNGSADGAFTSSIYSGTKNALGVSY